MDYENYDVICYKSIIMEKLYTTPEIFELIDNKQLTSPEEMINKNLFSRMKIPNETFVVKNYICFDYNSRINPNNNVFKTVTINMAVITHEDSTDTPFGNRYDLLAAVIINEFNWYNILGFDLELVSDTESILEKDYHVRNLQFRNLTANSLSNGVKMDGY